jgi:D-alanyl-D-alanine carboxypeptidase
LVAAALAVSACSDSKSNNAATSTTAAGKQPAYAAKLQSEMPDLMKANAIPGAVFLIKSATLGDWSATFGTGEVGKDVPLKLDDHFRVGSNTKTMTGTVILQLVQEGKLKLDDPISKFRPDVPNGENITIAQLAEMRSGLYSYSFDPGFNATLDSDPQKAWTPDELLAIAFKHPPNFPPGEKFNYSNTNTVLLGVVIEKVTGMTLSEAFQKRLFEPLKLAHTSLPKASDSSIPDPHPQGYQFGTNVETAESYELPEAQAQAAVNGTLKPINETNSNPSWTWAAGGAIATLDDLAVYVKALVSGGLINDDLQKQRLASVVPFDPSAPSVGYGLGITQFVPDVYGHDGQLPGFSTFMAYDLQTQTAMIVGTTLSASPVDGTNAAVVLAKPVLAEVAAARAKALSDPEARSPSAATTTTTG